MNRKRYLWEIIQDEQLNKEKIDLKISKRCSIYEVVDKNEIDISWRFSEEFKEYIKYKIAQKENGSKENFERIENIFLKMLGNMDLLRGMNKKSYIKKIILEKISENIDITLFDEEEKNMIALYYYKMKKIGSDIEVFKEIIEKIFFKVEFFYTKEKILLYIKEEKSMTTKRKMEVLIAIFLDINYPIRIFWNNYFGEIDNNKMMIIDRIEIY